MEEWSIQKHYFHFEHSDCPGVIPWLQKNNNCPVCRYKFPKKEEETTIEITNTDETTEETTTDEDIKQINIDINNFVNEILISQPMDVVRDGFLDSDVDEAMRRSLNEWVYYIIYLYLYLYLFKIEIYDM